MHLRVPSPSDSRIAGKKPPRYVLGISLLVGFMGMDIAIRAMPPTRMVQRQLLPGPGAGASGAVMEAPSTENTSGREVAADTNGTMKAGMPDPTRPEDVGRGTFPDSNEGVRRGPLASMLLATGEFVVAGGQLVPPGTEPAAFEAAQNRSMLQSLKSGLDHLRSMESDLGKPPWEEATFQAFGALLGGRSLTVLGNDHALPASVPQSLQWYEDAAGAPLGADNRSELATELSGFEIARRNRIHGIVGHIAARCQPDRRTADRGIFFVADGRISWWDCDRDERARIAVEQAKAEVESSWEAVLDAAR